MLVFKIKFRCEKKELISFGCQDDMLCEKQQIQFLFHSYISSCEKFPFDTISHFVQIIKFKSN